MDRDAPTQPLSIERRLRLLNRKTGETETIEEARIAGIAGPVVILGDPGLGKSVLTQKIGGECGNQYVRAGTFVRSRVPASFLPQAGGRLVIDGLDEVASTTIGGGVDAVLQQLSAIGNPPFILSSREADWRGASARVRIEDDYGEGVSILHLEPFDGDDANAFLRAFFPDVDAVGVLDYLADRGLDDIYRNPLTLRMIGEVARAHARLPGGRAELLEHACTIMLREDNPRHQDAQQHALISDEDLLLAAGAVCASLLVCDRSGMFTGPMSRTPDDFLHQSSVQNLLLAKATAESLKTRLFYADGEARFIACHRVVAEYLGARWLAHCFDNGVSERRIRSLVTQSGGVPTSLRGLNAWLAHFSTALAQACIAADPYAVLLYGNAETIALEQARTLLHELAKLSIEDPYFRAGDWSRHPAAGLMRIELKGDILAILSSEQTHANLAFLLLEAMAGSPIAGPLARDLEPIVFDPDRLYGARSRAADALTTYGAFIPTEPIIERLLALGDSDSQRIAFEILSEMGLATVSMNVAVETLLAHAGLTVSAVDRSEPNHSLYIPHKLFASLSATQLQGFLDTLSDYAAPLMDPGYHTPTEAVANAARTAVLSALKSGAPLTPDQIWRWLRWVPDYQGYDNDLKKALQQQLENNVFLKRGIQAAVLLSAPVEDLQSEAFSLTNVSAGLFPSDSDIIALIELVGTRPAAAPNLQQLRELVLLARTRSGLAAGVREAAVKLAGGDKSILRDLSEWSKPQVHEYEERQKRRAAKAHAERQETYRKIREDHAANTEDIRAGGVRWLCQVSKVYLGRVSSEFSKDDAPQVRVEKFLEADLAEDALQGFMAALRRDDLPSAAEIAQSHAENHEWHIETVLVCGVAETVRREIPLDTVPRPALDSAYMAWRRQQESNILGGIEIGPALESIVLADEAQAETFFRTSVEPQFQTSSSHMYDLYLLTHDERWTAVAGRLAVDWLIQNVNLPFATEAELLDAAVRHGDRSYLEKLLAIGRTRVHASFEALLEWLALDFVLDFERCRHHLADAVRDLPAFLWRIRRRAAGGRHGTFNPLTILQRAFIVETFGSFWPQTARPNGGSTGDTNPWDASDFIERVIYSIASEPTAEATMTLQRLQAETAPSYTNTLRHALALQRRLRRDQEYVPASIEQVRSVASNGLPETIDDMRAYFGDRVASVQARMHATNTDMWEAYWDGVKPRTENFCRNRLIEHISGQLPGAIRFEPEMHMPNQKRADIAVIRDAIGLPVEIKGQWHPEVWDAPVEQLASRYARDWHAEGRGVYIVIWFGNVPGKQLPNHPDELALPETPEALSAMLIERIPEAMQGFIDVYVVDVMRMR